MKYSCRNYRANYHGNSYAGSSCNRGNVLADLHHPDGTFYRVAVVAQCQNLQDAIRYAAEKNYELEQSTRTDD